MNHTARTTLGLIGACALAASLSAQSEPATSTTTTSSPSTTTTTTTPTPTPTTASERFTTFEGASPEVLTAVRNAQEAANAARISGNVGPSAATNVSVSRAVAQASAAITQEGRVARADLLAERQAALTRLRLAQSAAERERLVADLRTQTGQRMDEQRETARLVRDRLRELRDSTALTPKPGGS